MLRLQPTPSNKSSQSSWACLCDERRHVEGRHGKAALPIDRKQPDSRAMRATDTVTWDGGYRRFDDDSSGHLETLFVMEVEGCTTGAPAETVETSLKDRLTELSSPRGEFECQLLKNVQHLKSSCTVPGNTEEALAKGLKEIGYKIESFPPHHSSSVSHNGNFRELRQDVGTWHPSAYTSGFFAIQRVTRQNRDSCLVEPYFREHFSIQDATDRYTEILKLLPEEYVGPLERIIDLVKVVCQEMAKAFTYTGRELPPWRVFEKVASKWSNPWKPAECDTLSCKTKRPMNATGKFVPLDFKRLSPEEVSRFHQRWQSHQRSPLSDYHSKCRRGKEGPVADKDNYANKKAAFQTGVKGLKTEDVGAWYPRHASRLKGRGWKDDFAIICRGQTRLPASEQAMQLTRERECLSIAACYEQEWFGFTSVPPFTSKFGALVR